MDSAHRSQAGFTLIEVLLTTTITGMIIAAIASACYVGIHTTSDDRRSLDRCELIEARKGPRAWRCFQRVGDCARVLVCGYPLAQHARDGLAPARRHGVEVVRAHEALHATLP